MGFVPHPFLILSTTATKSVNINLLSFNLVDPKSAAASDAVLSFFRWCSCVDCTKVTLRGAVEERGSDSFTVSRALPGPQEKDSVPWC